MDRFPKARKSVMRKTLAEKKEITRKKLLLAAFDVFARDGFHQASLESIALEAGFSKGAVYSNFSNKSELFLAAMDLNRCGSELFDPEIFEPIEKDGEVTDEMIRNHARFLVDGFGLATLEFITVAIRDEHLRKELAARFIAQTEEILDDVKDAVDPEDPVTPLQIANMMGAFHLGLSVLSMLEMEEATAGLLDVGYARLSNPKSAEGVTVNESRQSVADLEVAQVETLIRAQLGMT